MTYKCSAADSTEYLKNHFSISCLFYPFLRDYKRSADDCFLYLSIPA
jgi:hypothetical protein